MKYDLTYIKECKSFAIKYQKYELAALLRDIERSMEIGKDDLQEIIRNTTLKYPETHEYLKHYLLRYERMKKIEEILG